MAKLVEILAKEMEKWPEEFVAVTQDDGLALYGWKLEGAEFRDGAWFSPEDDDCGMSELDMPDPQQQASDHDESIVTRAQWQAERDRKKGGEWKRHRGGEQPVDNAVYVEVKLRCGDVQQSHAQDFLWYHSECDHAANIMQYRIISQPQAEEVVVKDTTIGTLSYKVEIDTAEASQAIDALTAKWDQVDGPLLWRDTVNELDAYIEEFTREREAMINRLSEEGFALIPPSVSVVSKFCGDVDMSDWRNWKIGDEVEVILDNDADLPVGSKYPIKEIESQDYAYGMPVCVSTGPGAADYQWPEDSEHKDRLVFKFIRRP